MFILKGNGVDLDHNDVIPDCSSSHLLTIYLTHFQGGPDYVQIFSNIDTLPAMPTTFQLSGDRTHRLRDGDVSTCIPVFPATGLNSVIYKVLPRRLFFTYRQFVLHILGRGLSCSPIDGLILSIISQNMPEIHGDYTPCKILKGTESQATGDYRECKMKCHLHESWESILVEIRKRTLLNIDYNNWYICEIWHVDLK